MNLPESIAPFHFTVPGEQGNPVRQDFSQDILIGGSGKALSLRILCGEEKIYGGEYTLLLHLSLLLIVVSGWQVIAVGVAQVLKGCVELMQRLLEAVATLPYCSIDGLYPSALQVLLIYISIGGCFVALSLRFPATRRSV